MSRLPVSGWWKVRNDRCIKSVFIRTIIEGHYFNRLESDLLIIIFCHSRLHRQWHVFTNCGLVLLLVMTFHS